MRLRVYTMSSMSSWSVPCMPQGRQTSRRLQVEQCVGMRSTPATRRGFGASRVALAPGTGLGWKRIAVAMLMVMPFLVAGGRDFREDVADFFELTGLVKEVGRA